jgi:hypothetical protein
VAVIVAHEEIGEGRADIVQRRHRLGPPKGWKKLILPRLSPLVLPVHALIALQRKRPETRGFRPFI